MGIGGLPMGCWGKQYAEPLKILHNLACIGHSHKPSSPVSQPFTQLIQQGCSNNAYRKYLSFNVATTFYYPCCPLEYVSKPISILQSFLNTSLSLSQSHHIQWTTQKKKIFPIHSHFYPGTHHRIAFRPYDTSIQKLPKSKQQPSCSTHCAERTSNIPFPGWIGQRHLNTMPDSCTPQLNSEMFPSLSGI